MFLNTPENDPLDAPLTAPEPICRPAQMKKLARWSKYLFWLNSALLLAMMLSQGFSQFGSSVAITFIMQGIVYGLLLGMVVVGALFTRKDMPYEERFEQLMRLYYCAVQVLLLLVLLLFIMLNFM